MNNSQIIRALPKLKEKKKLLSSKRAELCRLVKGIEKLEDQLEILGKVSEIYDGVAINIYTFGAIDIQAVDYELTSRCAQVYQNAHNEWTFGFHTYEDSYGSKGDKWHGAHYPDYDEVIKFAKDWVVHGKLPRYQAYRSLEDVLCD